MNSNTIIIDYGRGNLHSVQNAFGGEVTSDPAKIKNASHIILPGVGAFADCLDKIAPLREVLHRTVYENGVPFLGICVGAQLMGTRSHENGIHQGFGWIDAEVVLIKSEMVPHMGWNDIKSTHPLFITGEHFYFVHSYHFDTGIAFCGGITAAVAKDNMVGVQFHPEKSQENGRRFIEKFLALK